MTRINEIKAKLFDINNAIQNIQKQAQQQIENLQKQAQPLLQELPELMKKEEEDKKQDDKKSN